MTKASENTFPKVLLGPLGAPTAPADASWKLYPMADGIYARSSNTTVGPFAASGAAVATDSIWDAAGDLAVGSGANTAARLALGAAGGAVSRVNGAVAWNSGTAFPTAATGDRYWRTDLGMEYYYDGTRWLSTQLMIAGIAPTRTPQTASPAGYDATQTVGNFPTRSSDGDIYVELVRYVAYCNGAGAFDGTNYWTLTIDKLTAANAATNISTVTMNSQTSNNWKVWKDDIDEVVVGADHVALRVVATKAASASNIILGCDIHYRLIAT